MHACARCVRTRMCVCGWVGNEKVIRSEEGWSASLVRPAPLISMHFHLSCDHCRGGHSRNIWWNLQHCRFPPERQLAERHKYH